MRGEGLSASSLEQRSRSPACGRSRAGCARLPFGEKENSAEPTYLQGLPAPRLPVNHASQGVLGSRPRVSPWAVSLSVLCYISLKGLRCACGRSCRCCGVGGCSAGSGSRGGMALTSKLEEQEDQEREQPNAACPPRRPVVHLAGGARAEECDAGIGVAQLVGGHTGVVPIVVF